MKVKVKCPASCGELIQGMIGDGEKLISLPIDIYSEVTIEENVKGTVRANRVKTVIALEETLKYFNVPVDYMKNISLSISSNIPIAKGMASSTADIAATIVATAKLLGKDLSTEELSELCCKIEPTDSTIFDKLVLFDHINGRVIRKHNWDLDMKVLILEMDSFVSTDEFRKNDYTRARNDNKKDIEKAYDLFSLACDRRDKKLLGEAVTISSLANQRILLKPKLEEILELTNKVGAYGVNVAHSGTVVGILYDDHVDVDKLKDLFVKRGITKDYVKIHLVNTTRGGVKIY